MSKFGRYGAKNIWIDIWERWNYYTKFSKGPGKQWRYWNIFQMKKGWKNWDFSDWRTEGSGRILSMWIIIWREGAKKIEPGSFQWCPVAPEAMGTNGNTGDSIWTTGNISSLWRWWTWNRLLGWSPSLELFKALWTWSWATYSRWPCLIRDGWTRWPSEVSFNLNHSFCKNFLQEDFFIPLQLDF